MEIKSLEEAYILCNIHYKDFSFGELNWLKFAFDLNMNSLKEIVLEQQGKLNDRRKELAEIENENKYDAAGFENALDSLKGNSYSSHVFLGIAILEGSMKGLCKVAKNEIKSKEKKGKKPYLENAQAFLVKHFGIIPDSSKNNLEAVIPYRKVRNILAHNGNEASELDIKIIDGLQYLKVHKTQDYYKIDIESHLFLENLIKATENYFLSVLLEVDQQYQTTRVIRSF